MRRTTMCTLLLAGAALGCEAEVEEETILLGEGDTVEAATYWSPDEATELTLEEIERGREDDAWRRAASIDSFDRAWEASAGVGLDTLRTWAGSGAGPDAIPDPTGAGDAPPTRPGDALPTRPDTARGVPYTLQPRDLGPGSVPVVESTLADTFGVALPVDGPAPGRTVMIVQILLDRAGMSPGIIDGRWGKNTEKAVYWLQRRDGLAPTGRVDSITYRRILELAGRPDRYVDIVALTEEDVAGPFVPIPEGVEAQAELDCMCYSSLAEKLGELFHVDPALLDDLNPGVRLDAVAAGDTLRVPAVQDDRTIPSDPVARIVISVTGHYLHLVDDGGRILRHFPTTLGSRYHPSPGGEYTVVSVTMEPWFHYQPALLGAGDGPDVRIPPGPNSPVGVVWIDLSKEHYGIHGTARPETIGYVTSHGCVRLTNWDARHVAARVSAGTPVEFRDVEEAPLAIVR